jgi:hypothetical protein
MNRILTGVAAAVLMWPALAALPTFDLFTASEAAAWNSIKTQTSRELSAPKCHASPDTTTTAAGNPEIKILAPGMDRPLSAPVDIDVQFIQAGNVPIQPETFRVCYLGFITVDITKRITDRVTVSAQGLHVAGAQLPAGHHHLLMLIADQQGHFGRHEATFDIK